MRKAPARVDRLRTTFSGFLHRTRTRVLVGLDTWQVQLASLRTATGRQALWRATWPLVVYTCAFIVAQYVGAALAFALSPKVESASPLYVQGAVTVSALLLAAPRRWWLYLVATIPAILVDAWLFHLTPSAAVAWVLVFVYIIIVCISVLTVTLLRRFVALPLRFATVSEVTRFVICVAIGAVPAAFLATALRSFVFSWEFWLSWETGYLGYVLGIVVFTPAIVLWMTADFTGVARSARSRATELALLALATLGVSLLAFGTSISDTVIASALIYLLVPVLLWAAVRFGPRGFSTVLLFATVIAVLGAVSNREPFVADTATSNVAAMQLYLLFVAVSLFFLAALVQERKQANTATRASEARYRAMFHSAAIGVAITDLDGRPLEVNEYASHMVGYTPDELRALALRDFTHPDDVADNEALLRRALEGDIGGYQLEKRYLHKDGHSVWGRLSASLVRDQDGQPAYFAVHLEDVTQRKQLEQEREAARREAERRAEELDRVFEAMADGVAVYDHDGREVRTNTALQRLLRTDLAPPEYADLSLHERMALFAAHDEQGRPLAADEGPLPHALRGEVATGSATMDIRSRTFEGRELEVSVSAAPLRDGAGHVTGAVALFRDQTERRRLEREHAEQAQQLQTIFDALADPLFVYDTMGRLARANPAARQLLYAEQTDATVPLAQRLSAYQVRDADGRPLPREDWPITHMLSGEVLAGAGAQEALVQLPDGRDALLSFTGGPIYDARGQLVSIVAIARDQTERRRLEREREAAREEAERQAAELAATFEAMADGVAVFDTQGQLVRENAALRRLLGADTATPDYATLSPSEQMELFGVRDDQGPLRNPAAGPLPRALLGDLVGGAQARNIGLRTLDGRDIEVGVSAAPLKDQQGEVAGAVVVLRDQTERNQLLRDRAEQAEQLDRIVEQMTEPLVVQDAAGRVVRVNAAMRRLVVPDALPSGYEEAPLPDRVALYTMRDAQGRPLAPEDTPNMRALRGEELTGEQAMDVRLRTPDGREAELRISAAPLRDHEGHIVGAVGVGVDLTERNQLAREREEALEASEAWFRTMADTAPVVLWVTDTEGLATFVNARWLQFTGRTLEKELGNGWSDVIHPDDAARSLEVYRAALRARQPFTMDYRARRFDGEYRAVLASGVPRFAADGTFDGYIGSVTDITEHVRLEWEHAAQAEQLDRIIEGIGEGLFVYDTEGNIVRTNAAARQLLGLEGAGVEFSQLSPEQRIALYAPTEEHDSRLLTPTEWLAARALVSAEGVLARRESRDIQMHALDGRELEVSASMAPLRGPEGQAAGAVLLLSDRTERNQLAREREEALARSQARSAELEAVLGAMTDGVVVYDATAHITYTNAAFRTLFAVETRPDYARLSLAERNALVHARTPEGHDLPADQLPQARALRGEVLASGADAADLLGDTVDGRTLTLQLAGGPLRDAESTVSGAVLVFRDVTAQRHLERATRELAVQLQATLDEMSDAVFLYGVDGQVLRLNSAAQALVDAEPDFPTVAGTAWWDRAQQYHPRRSDGHPLSPEEWPLARVLRGETLTAFEALDVVLTDPHGDEQVFNYVGGPARDAAGKLMGYVFVVRDVTERLRLQRLWEEARASELALREVNERLDTFVTVAAHDLRSPVAVSRMALERAQQMIQQAAVGALPKGGKQAVAVARTTQALAMAEHNLDRLWRLVQQLLDVSRVKAGTLVLQRQPVDLMELVRTCVDDQRMLTPTRVIALDLPEDSPADTNAGAAASAAVDASTDGGSRAVVVDADADRVGQVLTNYLINAQRYSAEDQPIVVSLRLVAEDAPRDESAGEETAGNGKGAVRGRQVACVEVRDRGIGIAPEDQATIWDRFQRARSVREASGLGLGLYIARMIVHLHGGRVGVESTVGQGSTFWFTLPLEPVRAIH